MRDSNVFITIINEEVGEEKCREIMAVLSKNYGGAKFLSSRRSKSPFQIEVEQRIRGIVGVKKAEKISNRLFSMICYIPSRGTDDYYAHPSTKDKNE